MGRATLRFQRTLPGHGVAPCGARIPQPQSCRALPVQRAPLSASPPGRPHSCRAFPLFCAAASCCSRSGQEGGSCARLCSMCACSHPLSLPGAVSFTAHAVCQQFFGSGVALSAYVGTPVLGLWLLWPQLARNSRPRSLRQMALRQSLPSPSSSSSSQAPPRLFWRLASECCHDSQLWQARGGHKAATRAAQRSGPRGSVKGQNKQESHVTGEFARACAMKLQPYLPRFSMFTACSHSSSYFRQGAHPASRPPARMPRALKRARL